MARIAKPIYLNAKGEAVEGSLESATARAKFPARVAPYYTSIGVKKKTLGFTSNGADEPGSWCVRVETDRNGKSHAKRERYTFAAAEGCGLVADGKEGGVMNYSQALGFASTWSPEAAAAAAAAADGVYYVRDAIADYRWFEGSKRRKTKKTDANMKRGWQHLCYAVLRIESKGKNKGKLRAPVLDAKGSVLPLLGDIEVNKLTVELLSAWCDAWTRETSEQSCLRIWSGLHSALDLAAGKSANGINNYPWRDESLVMNQEFEGRVVTYKHVEAIAIIEAARAINPHVGDYFEVLYRTGARPGSEVLTQTAGDYLSNSRRVRIRKGKTGPRDIRVGPAAVELYERLTAGKKSGELLFPKFGSKLVKEVLVAAVTQVLGDAAPQNVVPYNFRHTFITQRLEGDRKNGVKPVSAGHVALHCGNSEFIIRKTYNHVADNVLDDVIDASEPVAPAPAPLRLVA